MSWLYHGKIFEDKDIPEGAIGFIYIMTAIIDGKSVKYIGKKNFSADIKTKLGKKSLPTDKRMKKYKRVKKYTYQNYWSSNEILIQAHKNGVVIKREIIHICYSKTELSYIEVHYQFKFGVLDDDTWLNQNIMGKWFQGKVHSKQNTL